MLFDILALISIIILIALLKRLVSLFPSLMACLIRWKENINLESSIKQSHDRDILALGMILPFCLTVERFRLYSPAYMDGMNENFRILTISGVLIVYFIFRWLTSMIAQSFREKKRAYTLASRTAYTFFIILTITLAAMGGLLSFIHMETEVITSAMLWVSVFIYTLYMLRKFQIFYSGFPILTSFLYLCALEIVPTGLLVVSALLF